MMNRAQRLATFVGAVLCILGLFAGESFAQADFREGFDNNGPTQAGDVLTSCTISAATGKPDRLQVWYSSSGGTDTGANPNDRGDFDVLLIDINEVPNHNAGPLDSWTRHYEIALPGNGWDWNTRLYARA